MIITTAEQIEGKKIIRTIGLVQGNTIRARHLGRDIMAALRSLIGGEIRDYTRMMTEAREEAIRRLEEDARQQGANAIIAMRFSTAMVMTSASEILAYGTAVITE